MRISDWSSDVCSSDLMSVRPRNMPGNTEVGLIWSASPLTNIAARPMAKMRAGRGVSAISRWRATSQDRKSVVKGKSVSVRVDLGGSRIIKKKRNTDNTHKSINNHTKKHTTKRE